jgi:hypothetical protein
VGLSVICLNAASLNAASLKHHSAEICNYRFDTAANMLAYTELELSGEPLAESLGLDLDVLDPNERNQPTEFDYIAGIESYEFSEEGMYELNYRSGLGPSYLNGLRHKAREDEQGLQQYLMQLAKAVELPFDQVAKNLNLISLPYASGTPEFAQKVDTTSTGEEVIEWYGQGDSLIEKNSQIPAYTRDYKTLSWTQSDTDAVINPAAIGGLLLKEVMWSQDFLGGMHTAQNDEEVEATSSKMDQSIQYALGVSALDGMNGLILTELSLEKLQYLQQKLGFNGKALGQKITPDYDAKKTPIWFPHQIKVKSKKRQGKSAIDQLDVQDASARLRDSWMLLWPLSEYFAFTDQREANLNQNPAFAAVFDGSPFAATVSVNKDSKVENDIAAKDAFSMASNLSNLVFKNLSQLHFNQALGTFVDRFDGASIDKSTQGRKKSKGASDQDITTYDVAYTLVALAIYQRAQDALPVGYASGSSAGLRLHTEQGKLAIQLIKQQANFILNSLRSTQGLIADGATITTENGLQVKRNYSIDTQFAVIRGLTSAFLATQDENYRLQARKIYQAVERELFDAKLGTWTNNGKTVYTPYSVSAISSAMREAILHLKNAEHENVEALTLSNLIKRYSAWFRLVVTGTKGQPGLQLAEPIGDTGEHVLVEPVIKGATEGDSDGDGIKQITHSGGQYGRASVLASELIIK